MGEDPIPFDKLESIATELRDLDVRRKIRKVRHAEVVDTYDLLRLLHSCHDQATLGVILNMARSLHNRVELDELYRTYRETGDLLQEAAKIARLLCEPEYDFDIPQVRTVDEAVQQALTPQPSSALHSKTLEKPVSKPAAIQEDGFLPSTSFPFVLSRDYYLVRASKGQQPDAKYLRYKKSGSARDPNNLRLHPEDVKRFLLAKAYMPKSEFTMRYERHIGKYDEFRIAQVLAVTGISRITYHGIQHFPPGLVEIAELPRLDLERVASVARPLIERHGLFIEPRLVQELLGPNFDKQEFLRYVKGGEISRIQINTTYLYNLFQVVELHPTAFGMAAHV